MMKYPESYMDPSCISCRIVRPSRCRSSRCWRVKRLFVFDRFDEFVCCFWVKFAVTLFCSWISCNILNPSRCLCSLCWRVNRPCCGLTDWGFRWYSWMSFSHIIVITSIDSMKKILIQISQLLTEIISKTKQVKVACSLKFKCYARHRIQMLVA